jgi:hypothetical protein
MDEVNLRDLERRPVRYWNIDGLPELVMGGLWMLWGSAWLVGQALPRGQTRNLFWMFTPAILALTGVAATRMVKSLKARITFPRAGYVEWKEPTRGHRLMVAAIAVVTAGMLTVVIARSRAEGIPGATAPALGVILSLAFLVSSLRQRAPHLLALAGVALALGLAFSALEIGWEAANWLFITLGAATAGMGAVRLRSFLAANPLQERA